MNPLRNEVLLEEILTVLLDYQSFRDFWDRMDDTDRLMLRSKMMVCIKAFAREQEIPMGASNWKNHGQKYGYWEFFMKEAGTNFLALFQERIVRPFSLVPADTDHPDSLRPAVEAFQQEIVKRSMGIKQ